MISVLSLTRRFSHLSHLKHLAVHRGIQRVCVPYASWRTPHGYDEWVLLMCTVQRPWSFVCAITPYIVNFLSPSLKESFKSCRHHFTNFRQGAPPPFYTRRVTRVLQVSFPIHCPPRLGTIIAYFSSREYT